MTRPRYLGVAAGILLLACAVGSVFLASGTGDAARAFRNSDATWQHGLVPTPAAPPGRGQRAGEALLGISARSDVLRAYQTYRAGLANVIPGTEYPQTRARFEAIKTLGRLRAALGNRDRAAVDVVLGTILTDAASRAGAQREQVLKSALAAFVRAIREDPANAAAKHNLEVLLRATAPSSSSRSRPARPNDRKPRGNENPRNPTAPARAEGTGF